MAPFGAIQHLYKTGIKDRFTWFILPALQDKLIILQTTIPSRLYITG